MLQLFFIFQIDATIVEINPLAETEDGRVVPLDAKVNCDNNASFRQQELFSLNDTCRSKRDPREVSCMGRLKIP